MKFPKYERYVNEADQDFVIEKDKLSSAISTLPMLHSKWLRYYYNEQFILMKKETELKQLYVKKYEFYKTGYNLEIKETKLDYFIESDEEYSKRWLAVNAQKKIVSFLSINC